MDRVAYKKVIQLIDSLIGPAGYECVEIEWDEYDETLRVFIDNPAGVKMDDCLAVNSLLIQSDGLDALIMKDYRLEVSSPGIERPLRKKEHFEKHVGQKVNIQLLSKLHERAEGSGMLLGVDGDNVVSLELATGIWAVPLELINKAVLVYEW